MSKKYAHNMTLMARYKGQLLGEKRPKLLGKFDVFCYRFSNIYYAILGQKEDKGSQHLFHNAKSKQVQ